MPPRPQRGARPRLRPSELPLPPGVDAAALRRELDRERLRRLAPEIPPERLAHIARIREAIRTGRYQSAERLAIALARALGDKETDT